MHEQHTFMYTLYTLQHTLAYKFTYSRCDIHMLSTLTYDYYIINLFAETVLHVVRQVPMLVLRENVFY